MFASMFPSTAITAWVSMDKTTPVADAPGTFKR
jgi:hypothetical protein